MATSAAARPPVRPRRFLSGEAVEFLRWTAGEAPDARGYWPATAVANHALAGEAIVDNSTAATAYPLFDGAGWSETVCADCGVTPEAMPRVQPTGAAAGRVRDTDAVLAAGAVDAVCEQIVAGADQDGDVLVLCGTTLIVWVTIGEFREVPGLWTLPHTGVGQVPDRRAEQRGRSVPRLGGPPRRARPEPRRRSRTGAGVVAVRPR